MNESSPQNYKLDHEVNSKVNHKVIFDTDPGVDDAMALYFALAHPHIDLLGVTTTFGNVTVQQAATNALYLTHLAGRPVPVTQGVAAPLVKHLEPPPDYIHGADGLGNLPTRVACPLALDPRSSAQFIVDMARAQPGDITLVPVGPLGNLAQALKLEPKLPKLLKRVVLMGGAIATPGNVSPVAEANIWNDPHAADAVFTAGFDLAMVGLDVTYQVILPVTLFEKIAAHHQHPATDTLLHAVKFYGNFYATRVPELRDKPGCFGHDVLAFIHLLHPELFGTNTGRIRVVTDGVANGQTILNCRPDIEFAQPGWGPEVPNSTACMTVDVPAVTAVFEQTMMRPWLT